jgi:hypothetical protein
MVAIGKATTHADKVAMTMTGIKSPIGEFTPACTSGSKQRIAIPGPANHA